MNIEEMIAVEPTTDQDTTTSVFDNESIDSILNTLNGTVRIEPVQTVNVDSRVYVQEPSTEIRQDLPLDSQTANEITNRVIVSAIDESSIVEMQCQEETVEEEQHSSEELIDQITEDFNVLNEEQHDNVSRFSGAEWFEKVRQFRIVVAGIGGIGSYVSFFLSRLQPDCIHLFDNDNVEEANLSGQLFGMLNIGETKVGAMSRFIDSYSNYYRSNIYNERYTGQLTEDIMVCGFDNMEARKVFFTSWKIHVSKKLEEDRKKCLYIDGRLGLEEMQIFAIRGDETENMGRYADEFLFSDAEAEQVPCSMKQTTFMASMIGSVMTNILVNHAVNIDSPMDIRPIPFLTLYDASDMRMQLKF